MIYLDKQQWSEKYAFLNSIVKNEFYKLEILPSYNDYGITDWNNVPNAEMLELIKTAQISIYKSSKDIVDEQLKKGVDITRVRYLTFPLSKYILRQFSVYKIYVDLGVNIQIFEGSQTHCDFDMNFFRDFLLFDEKYLLLLDNPNGCYNGGFYSENDELIKIFINIKNQLAGKTIPFETYIGNFNIYNKSFTEKD